MNFLNRYRAVWLISVAFIGLSLWTRAPIDPDLGWHLLGGDYVLNTGTVPHKDFINTFRTDWHDYHWLAQVALASLYRWNGFLGLQLFLAAYSALTFLLISLFAFKTAPRRDAYWAPMIASAVSIYIFWLFTTHRPQALVMPGIVAAMWIARSRNGAWEALAMFALAALLANMHVYWIFVPLIWLVYRCIPSVVDKSSSQLIPYTFGVLILLSLAGLLSPYGTLSNYNLIWNYIKTPSVLKNEILELRPVFADPGAFLVIWLGLFSIAIRSLNSDSFKKGLPDTLILLIGIALSGFSLKYGMLLGIFCIPFLLILFSEISLTEVSKFIPFGGCACGLTLLTSSVLSRDLSTETQLENFYPIKACRYLAENPLSPSNNRKTVTILTSFDHGGWCRWEIERVAPNSAYRVTADGRTQNMPEQYFNDLFDLFHLREDWLSILAKWRPDAAVLSKETPLAQFLALSQQNWRMTYQDSQFAVFLPNKPES